MKTYICSQTSCKKQKENCASKFFLVICWCFIFSQHIFLYFKLLPQLLASFVYTLHTCTVAQHIVGIQLKLIGHVEYKRVSTIDLLHKLKLRHLLIIFLGSADHWQDWIFYNFLCLFTKVVMVLWLRTTISKSEERKDSNLSLIAVTTPSGTTLLRHNNKAELLRNKHGN